MERTLWSLTVAILAGDNQLTVLAECGFSQVDGLHFGVAVVAAYVHTLNGVYLVVALRRVQLIEKNTRNKSDWMDGWCTLAISVCVPWQRLAPEPWCRRAG